MFVWYFEVLTRFKNDSLISKLIWKSPVLKKSRGIKLQEIWISLKMGRWEINLRIKISNTKLWSFICSKVYCDYLLSHWCMRLIIKVSGETLINTWGMNTLMTELSSILLLMLISLHNHTSWLTSHWFTKSAGCAHFQCLSYFFATLGICFFLLTNWHYEVSWQEISGVHSENEWECKYKWTFWKKAALYSWHLSQLMFISFAGKRPLLPILMYISDFQSGLNINHSLINMSNPVLTVFHH